MQWNTILRFLLPRTHGHKGLNLVRCGTRNMFPRGERPTFMFFSSFNEIDEEFYFNIVRSPVVQQWPTPLTFLPPLPPRPLLPSRLNVKDINRFIGNAWMRNQVVLKKIGPRRLYRLKWCFSSFSKYRFLVIFQTIL